MAFSRGWTQRQNSPDKEVVLTLKMSVRRKPLRKEENGTSRGEYAMSIRNKKAMGTNNTVV